MSQDPSMGGQQPEGQPQGQPEGYGVPPPPGGPVGPGGQPPVTTASLGLRIGGRLLDAVIVGIPASIILSLVGLGTFGFGVRGWAGGAIFSVLWFGYFVWFESNQGATVGKKLLKIQVLGTDGNFPSMEVAAKRNVWMLFGLVPFVGGLVSLAAVIVIIVTISSNADNRGYHDTFAGTTVTVNR